MPFPQYSYKVLFNCYCAKCKKYQAERIEVKKRGIGFVGLKGYNCKCGYKKKVKLWKTNLTSPFGMIK